MVVFRQVKAARRRNTLCPMCVVIGSLLIPSWGPKPGISELGTERAGPFTCPGTLLFITTTAFFVLL